jgi:hypothetical protein
LALRLHPSLAEERMILTPEHPATNLYRVEVSGWDDKKSFFVENSDLEWADDSSKQVTLNRGLSEGAVIFLRLLQPISSDRSHAVAYQAEFVARNPEGRCQFRLRPVSSRERTAFQ